MALRYSEAVEMAQAEIISAKEVLKSTGAVRQQWKEAAEAEMNKFLEAGCRPITKDEVRGREVLPMQSIFSLKPKNGTYEQRSRGVVRGDLSKVLMDFTTASVPDATTIRTIVALAGGHQWSVLSGDVKGAFLKAPVPDGQSFLIRFPRIWEELGVVCADTLYESSVAMYGRRESPRWWTLHRNRKFRDLVITTKYGVNLRLVQGLVDSNVFKAVDANGVVHAYVVAYVDDLLITGPDQDELTSILDEIEELWELSSRHLVTPTNGEELTFLGYELAYKTTTDAKGRGSKALVLNQRKYVAALLQGRNMADATSAKTAGQESVGEEQEAQENATPSASDILQAQTMCGELVWISSRSRPDVAHAVAVASSQITTAPRAAAKRCQHVLRYLRDTPELGLVARPFQDCDFDEPENDRCIQEALQDDDEYMRTREEAEQATDEERWTRMKLMAWGDSSFAPKGERSHGGSIITLGSSPLMWRSHKQSMASESTCESELLQQTETAQMALGLEALLSDLQVQALVEQACDNRATLQKLGGAASWKSRHYSLRAMALKEKAARRLIGFRHASGTQFPADGLTKHLSPIKMKDLIEMLGMNVERPRFVFSKTQPLSKDLELLPSPWDDEECQQERWFTTKDETTKEGDEWSWNEDEVTKESPADKSWNEDEGKKEGPADKCLKEGEVQKPQQKVKKDAERKKVTFQEKVEQWCPQKVMNKTVKVSEVGKPQQGVGSERATQKASEVGSPQKVSEVGKPQQGVAGESAKPKVKMMRVVEEAAPQMVEGIIKGMSTLVLGYLQQQHQQQQQFQANQQRFEQQMLFPNPMIKDEAGQKKVEDKKQRFSEEQIKKHKEAMCPKMEVINEESSYSKLGMMAAAAAGGSVVQTMHWLKKKCCRKRRHQDPPFKRDVGLQGPSTYDQKNQRYHYLGYRAVDQYTTISAVYQYNNNNNNNTHQTNTETDAD